MSGEHIVAVFECRHAEGRSLRSARRRSICAVRAMELNIAPGIVK